MNERVDIKNLIDHVNAILSPGIAGYVRADELKQFKFENIEEHLAFLFRLCEDLKTLPLTEIPVEIVGFAAAHLNEIRKPLANMLTFSPIGIDNPGAVRDSIAERFRQASREHREHLMRIVSYFGQPAIRAEELNKMVARARELEQKLEGQLEILHKASEEKTISQHAQAFRTQAEEHDTAANWWLGSTLLTAMGLAVLIWWLFVRDPAIQELIDFDPQWAFEFTSRLLLVSVATFIVVRLAKNYLSQRHNYVVSKHRLNALETFQTFAIAADADKEQKHALLNQAAGMIFSAQPTGYLDSEPAAGMAPIDIKTIVSAIKPETGRGG